MLASSNVSDAQNLAAVAHLAAIKSHIPFLHFFDGFRTSHEISSIKELDLEKLKEFIPWKEIDDFKKKALNIDCGFQRGMAMNEDIFFQTQEARNKFYEKIPNIVNDYMKVINKIMGTTYKPFEFYGDSNAENIIVAMGSVSDTIKLVVDKENKNGNKVGLINVHLYRPFSVKYLLEVMPKSVRNIAVLDRTKEAGSSGEPLYLDIVNALKDTNIKIVGGRYGLSSKNTTPADIKSVFKMLENELKNNFTIGIVDDVTNTSLPKEDYYIDLDDEEILIYGFGSDGCVSASKDTLKILGKNGYCVNGYFSYDSKKSGGITVSNLRFSKREIRAPFYVFNPRLVIITKDEYLKKFDFLDNIKDNGTLIINTKKTEDEINIFLKNKDKEILLRRNIKVYIIDAYDIAASCGISGKVSKIIEMLLLNELKTENGYQLLKQSIENSFRTKGQNIVDSNIKAIEIAVSSLKEIKINDTKTYDDDNNLDVIDKINKRMGDNLTVSEVEEFLDGRFPNSLSRLEKRHMNTVAPKWISEACIECGRCSFVCPHAVIRSFITKENRGIPYLINKDYNYEIMVSEEDCTECGLCILECPGKNGKKALEFGPINFKNKELVNDYFNSYQNPEIFNKFNVPGASLCKPKLEFSGACAGCGETPYINLITRLYGDELVIANATGCSSIYGGSVPSTPYSIPWANSLFEDNAEFALGMHISYENKRNLIKKIMLDEMDSVDESIKEIFNEYIANMDNFKITYEVKNILQDLEIPKRLRSLINYIPKRTVLALGGDGWAYDIGFGGLEHVLESGENIKIMVLDTEVYSNTGGQASKASRIGQVAEFADFGKRTPKKDLFRIAMAIPNCYVASISLGANMMHSIKVMKEAMEHKGPALIIAYAPCIEHGIKTGMSHSILEEKLASEVGYTLLMRYKPEEDKLYLDNKEPNFTEYDKFLNNETRYNALKIKDAKLAEELVLEQIDYAKKKYAYYKKISEE